MKTIMSSAAEAEIGAMYVNSRKSIPARQSLNEMGHHRPWTPMQNNNRAAHSVVTKNVQPKRTKVMNMSFHWLWFRDVQDQFRYYWRPGSQNWDYYWTKHFPASHHINLCPEFLTPTRNLENLKRQQMKAVRVVKISQEIADSSPAMRVC